MRCARVLSVIDCWWIRVVIGGIPHIPGSTLQDKTKYFEHNLDYLRTALIHEPRGNRGRVGCIITAPTSQHADLGLIFMGWGGYFDMCGGGIIGAGTVAVTTGMIPAEEPITHFVFETPAGLIPVRATIEQNKVQEVAFQNVVSFVTLPNQTLQFKGLEIPFNTVHSGNRFCIIDAKDIGIDVVPENTDRLISTGFEILQVVNTDGALQQSESEKEPLVHILQISQAVDKTERRYRNIHVNTAGGIDLSPCGTGTCAKMTLFYSRGELSLGEVIINEGLTGEQFKGRLLEEKQAGPYPGVVPELSGISHITGLHYVIMDPDDPFKHGNDTV